LLAAIIGVLTGGAALGATDAVTADEKAAKAAVLEEVKVTATRTGETALQETAMAVSYLGGEDLKSLAMWDSKDIEYLVPSMQNLKVGHVPTLFVEESARSAPSRASLTRSAST